MRRLIDAWRRHPWLVSAFGLALLVTVFFAVRMVVFTVYWADPAHRDQHLAGWMTPRYVAHSWRVPPEVLSQALDLQPARGRPPTLQDIARDRDIPLAELIARIEAAIAAHRAGGE